MSGAREAVLARIRAATGPDADDAARTADWRDMERGYRQEAGMTREQVLEQFADRLRDYDAGVVFCAEDEAAGVIAGLLAGRGVRRMAAPEGVAAEWLAADVEWVTDAGGSVEALDACEGVLTGATLGISETGTIVLQAVAGQGRRAATLLPDYHLCVVRAEDVVRTVPEAMARLDATARLATTFFSGPSATADIEMTRIKGVHGPRFVDVVVVG